MSDKTNKILITAKEVVDKFKISPQTVNHYTNFGLLVVVSKKGNVRMYAEGQVKKRLAKISKFVNEGYSLRLIRKKFLGV